MTIVSGFGILHQHSANSIYFSKNNVTSIQSSLSFGLFAEQDSMVGEQEKEM